MAKQTLTKRAYYKRGMFLKNKDKITLQSTVSAALKKLSTVGQRKEILGEDDTNIRSIIYHRANQNMLFGIFASYEKGTHQLTIADDDDAEMLLVEQVAPPEAEDKKRREFLEGVCYFAFFGNHVVVIQSSALGTKHLERHLNWLLRTAGLIDTENSVGLTDFILEATKEKIRASHVKDLVIGTPLVDIDHVTAMKETTSQKTTLLDFGGKGITLLRDFLGEDKLKGLKLADAIDGNIEISLRIRYKQKTTEKGHELLDNLAIAARHFDEDDVRLTLVDGGTVKGAELKLSKLLRVEAYDGIPNPDDLFPNMAEWLRGQLESKMIEP